VTLSPESRLLLRYGLTAVLAVIGVVIAPHAYSSGRLYSVMIVAVIVTTRVVVVAPHRFAFRNLSRGWRRIWYLLIVQIVLLAVAFTLALSSRGSVPVAWAALALAVGIEIFVSRRTAAEHVRAGTLVPWAPYPPSDAEQLTAEPPGPAARALQAALADVYADVPTVVRAYFATAPSNDGRERRVLALRFAFPWVDDDAIVATVQLFGYMIGSRERLEIFPLDDRSERSLRAITEPFYERVKA
jgi:hypothetical protein